MSSKGKRWKTLCSISVGNINTLGLLPSLAILKDISEICHNWSNRGLKVGMVNWKEWCKVSRPPGHLPNPPASPSLLPLSCRTRRQGLLPSRLWRPKSVRTAWRYIQVNVMHSPQPLVIPDQRKFVLENVYKIYLVRSKVSRGRWEAAASTSSARLLMEEACKAKVSFLFVCVH